MNVTVFCAEFLKIRDCIELLTKTKVMDLQFGRRNQAAPGEEDRSGSQEVREEKRDRRKKCRKKKALRTCTSFGTNHIMFRSSSPGSSSLPCFPDQAVSLLSLVANRMAASNQMIEPRWIVAS